jgi:hypothetical protein
MAHMRFNYTLPMEGDEKDPVSTNRTVLVTLQCALSVGDSEREPVNTNQPGVVQYLHTKGNGECEPVNTPDEVVVRTCYWQ